MPQPIDSITRSSLQSMLNPDSKLKSSSRRNSLGMDGSIYKQLLKKLDENAPEDSQAPPTRTYTRLEYLDPYLNLTLLTSDRARREFTVATRNISRGGMSLLHASYVYPGTRINAQLRRADDSIFHASGKVCRCIHRGGVVHEIGIEFDTEIIVQEFVHPDINNSITSLETVDPETLEGKALFVGNDKEIMPVLRQSLIATNIKFGFVNTAKHALEKDIDQNDLIFINLDAGNMTGPEFATYLRENGYRKPIILAGKADTELLRQQIRLSNADMFLPTPIDEKIFMCALGEFLLTDWSEKTLEAVRSGIDKDTVLSIRTELTKLGIMLDQQIHADDPVKVYATCTKIRSIAPLLGMKNLRDLANQIGEEIAMSGDLFTHEKGLNSIKLLCNGTKKAA
jgi:CheY-like chemotaxis protein